MAFLIGGANSAADTGYDIENSCRFNPGDSPKLSFDQGTPTSRRIWTYSLWVKRGNLGNVQASMISWGDTDYFDIRFQDGTPDDGIIVYISDGAAKNLATTRLFRDPSAWYHIVINSDTTDGTAGDRTRIYVDGVEETVFTSEAQPDQNFDYAGLESGDPIVIGNRYTGSHYFDGYIAEAHFVDGQQLTPSSFGETDADSGIWKPKEYTGSYGTNGFFLEFKNSAVGTGASDTIGADTSGNDNHLTSTNVAVTDQCTDTPTNNFATFNRLDTVSAITLSEGNTKATVGTTHSMSRATMGVRNGKWYWENYIVDGGAGALVGAVGDSADIPLQLNANPSRLYRGQGTIYSNGSLSSGWSTYTADDIISVALDMDNGAIYFYKNGTIENSGTAAYTDLLTATPDHWLPGLKLYDESILINFGNPNWALTSGNADANGYGNFEYAVPSGYFALCTKNLAEYG